MPNDNPLYVLPFFEEFFRHYSSEFEILQLSVCRPMGKRPRLQLLHELVALYGCVGFAKLGACLVMAKTFGMLPRQPGARRFYTIRQLCRAYGVPFRPIGDPNAVRFVNEVAARAADIIVSVACPYILKSTLLELPRLGCINIHSARLPKYKGMMPTFWQMLHGEKELGITVHYMTRAIDQGSIVLQESIRIEPGESLHHLILRSKRYGAHCMARVLRRLEGREQLNPIRVEEQGSYFTFPTLNEIREFRRRGLRAI